jgi:hypothetical protein
MVALLIWYVIVLALTLPPVIWALGPDCYD